MDDEAKCCINSTKDDFVRILKITYFDFNFLPAQVVCYNEPIYNMFVQNNDPSPELKIQYSIIYDV